MQFEPKLGVDGVALFIDELGIKGRADKKLRKTLQPLGKPLVLEVKVIIGKFSAGPGVVTTAVPIDNLRYSPGRGKVSVPRNSICSRK